MRLAAKYSSSGTAGVLLKDRWFRLAAVLVLILGVTVGLMLPKIWLTTPEGFEPEIRISWLDVLQARSLKKTAERHAEAGQMSESIYAWKSAVANDPGDPELLRAGIRTILSVRAPTEENLGFGFQRLMWLLRLTQTNRVDAELAVEFLGRYDLDSYLARAVESQASELSDPSAGRYLKSLYRSGRFVDFQTYWESRRELFEKDKELRLYQAAWLAVHGPPLTLQSGRQELREATRDPEFRVLAARLSLAVHRTLLDVAGFEDALRLLEDNHLNLPSDHALHWQLLWSVGQGERAKELASVYSTPPKTADQAVALVGGFERLGMLEYGADFLDKYKQTLGYSPELWFQQYRLLSRLRQWQRMRGLANAMRSSPLVNSVLYGFSFYVEGIAEARLGRRDMADRAMKRVPELSMPDERVALSVAYSLRDEGYPELASTMLSKLQEEFADQVEFWLQLTMVAFESRDQPLLIRAAERAYELNPNSLATVNNYAGVLLATRSDPAEAVKLTLMLLLQRPNDTNARLNHVLSLLQNQRLEEASSMLLSINTLQLDPVQTSVYHFAWFELNTRRENYPMARASYVRVDKQRLVPVQAQWMDSQLSKFPDTATD